MDVEHDDILIADGKYDAVFAFSLIVEQLAEFSGNFSLSAVRGQPEGWRVSVSICLKRP